MTDDDRAGRPTPGPNQPVPSWPEYDQLKTALHEYLDHEPDDPAWDDIWRALAAILGDYQRDAFIQTFDLAEPAETPCIRRLITGAEGAHTMPSRPTRIPTARRTARRPTTTRRCGSTTPASRHSGRRRRRRVLLRAGVQAASGPCRRR